MQENKIFKAICGVMADIGHIGKDNTNQQQRYKFRGIDQVYNAMQPAMIKNGVFAVPNVSKEERTERQNEKGTVIFYSRLHVTYRFYADDGSFVEATVIGEAMDTGDKATNKAMSAAYKYACFQVFCIPTEEMIDSENNTYEDVQSNQQQQVPQDQQPDYDPSNDPIDEMKKKTLIEVMKKKGVSEKAILDRYKINSLEEMKLIDWMKAMKGLEKTPDKQQPVDLGI